MSGPPPLLSLKKVGKSYGGLTALEGLDLDLHPGECVALMGHNGSGKTTALKLASGRLEPGSGEVRVGGEDIHAQKDSPLARRELAFVPDEVSLYDDLTVSEHLELVGLAHGVGESLDEDIEELLEALGLGEYRGFLPPQLSRGLKQKTQLSCAFVRPFSIILLDEPVVGLDPRSQHTLHELLVEARSEGGAVLFSTHQPDFAEGLADRAVILEAGRAVAEGSLEEISREAQRFGLL